MFRHLTTWFFPCHMAKIWPKVAWFYSIFNNTVDVVWYIHPVPYFYIINNEKHKKIDVMTYKLLVKETNNKAAKFQYSVVDENGQVISTRSSNREYVACTIHGTYYFGRLDLIGKGDHANHLKRCSGHKWTYVNGRGKWVFDPSLPTCEPMAIAYK